MFPSGASRSRTALVTAGLLAITIVSAGCSHYTGEVNASSGATRNSAVGARSIEVQVVNVSDGLEFDDVGFGLEDGDWVAEPREGEPLRPGHRIQIMAESLTPQEPVAGYVTFVGEGDANFTFRFRNSVDGPQVDVAGSRSDWVTVQSAGSREQNRASYLVTVDKP